MREVGLKDDPNLGMLTLVANALGDLRDSLVFVGVAPPVCCSRPRVLN